MVAGAAARAADVAIESARAGVGSRVFFKTETVKLQEVFFDAGSVPRGTPTPKTKWPTSSRGGSR